MADADAHTSFDGCSTAVGYGAKCIYLLFYPLSVLLSVLGARVCLRTVTNACKHVQREAETACDLATCLRRQFDRKTAEIYMLKQHTQHAD